MTVHTVRRGLDVPLAGAPEQMVHAASQVTMVGVLPRDTIGLKPRVLVEPGDTVRLGQPLFADRRFPDVRCTAPGAGRIVAVHRGDRRLVHSIVIGLDDAPREPMVFEHFTASAGDARASARALLLESGLWTAFRTRPFSRVPMPDTTPAAIFVTAVDSHPHAPDLDVVLQGRDDDLARGLAVLTKLTDGPVHLCRAANSRIGDDATRAHASIRLAEFSGPHPSGTVGYHIHTLDPVHRDKTIWHVGAQDVVRIGHLFATGVLDVTHVISLAGPLVRTPRLLRTQLGASVRELLDGELLPSAAAPAHRVISGSILHGVRVDDDTLAFLGRHHQQITVLAEGGDRRLFGWLTPRGNRFSLVPALRAAFARSQRTRALPLDTSLHGSRRAMVPVGAYERIMPMDLMITHLLRAISVGDVEWAEQLGVLELDEEDVALCTFVCPSKYDFGPALRRTLDAIVAED